MGAPRLEAGRATWVAAAALICSMLSQRLSQTCRQTQLLSETCAWALLVLLAMSCRLPTRLPTTSRRTVAFDKGGVTGPVQYKRGAVWMTVLCLAVVAIYPSQFSADGFLPVLMPLLLLVETRVRSGRFTVRSSNAGSASAWSSSSSSLLTHSLAGTTLVAAIAVGGLVDRTMRDEVYSLVPLAARLVIFSILTSQADGLLPLGPSDPTGPATAPLHSWRRSSLTTADSIIVPVSLRVAVVLLVPLAAEMYQYGLPPCPISTTLALALAKAMAYFLLYETSRHSSWRMAAAIETFALISARDPFTQTTERQAVMYVAGSLLSIAQAVQLLPLPREAPPYRSLLFWVFSLATVLPYLAFHADRHHIAAHGVGPELHPVEALMRQAQTRFDAMLQRQSQNATAAVAEYRRRYGGVPPPPGFEAWFAFAQAHDSPIIDEFDLIHEAMAPLWALSGQEVQSIMRRVQTTANAEVWLCTFEAHAHQGEDGPTTTCSHPHRTFDRHVQRAFNMLLGGSDELTSLHAVLPDKVQFLVNHLDEPRVVIPPGRSDDDDDYTITTLSQWPVWEPVTRYCPLHNSSEAAAPTEPIINTYGLPFVTDVKRAQDLCRHHPAYRDMHGLLMSPASFHLIEGRVPVLSPGALSTMGDILFPSAAYTESAFRYDPAQDIAWEDKRNQLYWAGSTTGGAGANWRQFHRHRFVALAQQLAPPSVRGHQYLFASRSDQWGGARVSRVRSRFLNGRLFDVAFTRVFQCVAAHTCRDQQAYLRTTAWAPAGAAFRSRLVFDLDGNGISGRFYRLLASRSAPLKQTLLREWHDERLQPWLHYFPVSQSLDELPELVAYLTRSPAGVAAARRVADEGRAWFQRAFRDVDMAIYTYRLLLELARLQDPARPAGVPVG